MSDSSLDQAERLVTLLSGLSASGRAALVRRAVDADTVYCFVGGELVTFTAHGEDGPVPLDGPVHGVSAEVGGISFLWLEGICGWDALLPLLRAAPVDDAGYSRLYREAVAGVVDRLRRAATGG